MENKKTISYLNTKAWYRLLKVLFVFILIVSLSVGLFPIFNNNSKTIDYTKSELHCNNGLVVSLNDVDSISNHDYYDLFAMKYGGIADDVYQSSLDKNLEREFKRLCRTDGDLGKIAKLTYPNKLSDSGIKYSDYSDVELGKMIREGSSSFLTKLYPVEKNYNLSIISKNTILNDIGYVVLVLVINLLGAEFLRRIFYYVVLGSIKPKK